MAERSAVALEVVRHALAGVADQMGVALRRAAYSPNIKERADCSAAVFAPDGEMVAQAEHIPVHLGAMPASVAAVLARGPLEPGTHVLVNDPYAGGSHLPDLTLVAAVGDDAGTLLGYVANRAHHADVGGAAPGSMPASATDIAMEGLRLPPVVLVEDGRLRGDVIDLVAAASRTPGERVGDLRAQLAANHVGARRLRELAARRGVDDLLDAMAAVRDYSERRIRAALVALPDGSGEAVDVLETAEVVGHDAEVRALVTIDGDRLVVDLTGSSDQIACNLNAPRAVAESAALFVLRVVADPEVPANDGVARALEVRTRPGSVVDAAFPAPVAAGNVETSQRIVDVVFAALADVVPDRVPAASQGTMNNLLLGAAGAHAFGYYETIAGGEGGTPWRAGMSGVHSGMTNTRNTPAEAMEHAYPLRVWRAELRRGSGGPGRHPGGDGVVREIEALVDCTLTLQTERRRVRPRGVAGGGDGAAGRNVLVRDGEQTELPSKGTWSLHAGDRVLVASPGGGGWGAPDGPVAPTARVGPGEPGQPAEPTPRDH